MAMKNMKKILPNKILPRDIIAIITLCGGLILLGLGINHIVGTLLTSIIFFYFGAEALERRKRQKS